MDIIMDNPDKPWDWYSLSIHPNITWDVINDNLDKPWDWYYLSRNEFKCEKALFISRKYREHIAAFKIQTYWRRANEDPEYNLCKRRLDREYNDFFNE
jgi:hypothetical protein